MPRDLLRRLNSGPVAFLILMLLLFWLVPETKHVSPNGFGFYNSIQQFSTYGLVAAGVALTIFVREFDLSALGLFPLAGAVAAKTGNSDPVLGLLLVVGLGLLVGLVQGGIVTKLKINSMSLTFGSAIVLFGLASMIGNGDSIEYNNAQFGVSMDAQRLTIFSWHSVVCLALFLALAAFMRFTRWGAELLSVGGDPPASRAAGVRVDRYVIGTFAMSGMFTGLAAGMLTYGFGAADVSAPAWPPLIYAVTAALIGGVGLSGGQGNFLGILCAALGLSLLQQMFTEIAAADFVSSLVTGGLLVLIATVAAPELRGRLNARRRVSGTDVVAVPDATQTGATL